MGVLRWISIALLSFSICGLTLAREDRVVIDETFDIADGDFEVKIDIDGGEILVTESRESHQCEVHMEYPKERCEGDVRFHERRNQMNIDLNYENWKFWKDHGEDDHAEVVVKLPYKPHIDLSVKIKAGETDLQLGDLSLKNFQLSHWAGETKLDFDEPNRIAMDTFDIGVKVGEVELLNLGNANFEQADINGGIGEMTIDFSGATIERAVARIDLDIGETRLIVPEDIGTKLRVSKFLFLSDISYPNWFEKKGKYYYSDNYDEAGRTLYLMISTGIGELSIRVR
jgi:hypothetical protein